MNFTKSILVVIFAFACVFEASREASAPKRTSFDKVTVSYLDIDDQTLAEKISKTLASDAFFGTAKSEVEFRLSRSNGRYQLDMPLRNAEPSTSTLDVTKVFARLLSDHCADGTPVDFRLVYEDQVIAISQPSIPFGEYLAVGRDILLYSKNITPDEAKSIAAGLQEIESFTNVGTIVYVKKRPDRYILVHPSDADLDDRKVKRKMRRNEIHNLKLYRDKVFAGAAVEAQVCNLKFDSFKDLSWRIHGGMPGAHRVEKENVHVEFSGEVSEQTALRIAERITHFDFVTTVRLSGESNHFEVEFNLSVAQPDLLPVFMQQWGRDVYSELDQPESLTVIYVDGEGEIEFATPMNEGSGSYVAFKENRLYYPDGTSQEMIDVVFQGLREVGFFKEESCCTAVFKNQEGRRVLQLVSFEQTNELINGIPKYVGESFESTLLANEPFSVELIDHRFAPVEGVRWNSETSTSE